MVTLTGLFLFNFIPPPLFSEVPRRCNIVTLVTVPLLAGHLNRTYQPRLIYDTIFFSLDIVTFITELPRTLGWWWQPAGPGSRTRGGDTGPRPASAILRPSPGRSPANISRSEASIMIYWPIRGLYFDIDKRLYRPGVSVVTPCEGCQGWAPGPSGWSCIWR